MAERKLTELEIERRIERAHPASVIARLFAVSVAKRLRWTQPAWQEFNGISRKFSATSEFTVGAMLGAFVADTGRKALGGSDAAMDAALANPDWPAIEQAVRILLAPGSKFLTAPTEAPQAAPAPKAERKGMAHVPSAPPSSRP